MKKELNKQILVIIVLFITLVTMSICFAAFSSQINMASSYAVSSNLWNVHFEQNDEAKDTITISKGSKDINIISNSGTVIQWSTLLNKPGDYAEFTINVVNEGSLNARLKKINIPQLTKDQSKYLRYKVYYDNVLYNDNIDNLNTLLEKQSGAYPTKVPVKIKVEYYYGSVLPENDELLTFTTILEYEQAK